MKKKINLNEFKNLVKKIIQEESQPKKKTVRITESQLRAEIKKMLKEESNLNEIDFKKLGLGAALAGGLSTSSMGQDVEPTGKFSFPTDYGGKRDKVVIDSNIVNITSPTQIADIIKMVFTQHDSLLIPIDRENISKTNFILKNVIIDSTYGGQNLDGYYFVPKGVRSEDDIFNSPLLKKVWGYLKATFGKNVRLPIKNVRMDDNTVIRFLKLIESGQTPFSIKRDRNGREVIYIENQY